MLSDAGSFAAAISWTVQLLAVPPWTALYALIVNWGTFSYGDRVLDWFAYDICGLPGRRGWAAGLGLAITHSS